MDTNRKNKLAEYMALYADIPEKELNSLLGKTSTVHISKDEYFLRQGDSTSKMALISSGLFRVFCIDINGHEKTLSFRKEGQFLAGYSPFIRQKEIWYSIQALEDSQLVYIDFNAYRKLEQTHPCWNELIKNYMTELFMEKEERERSFLLDDARTRYAAFIQKYPGFEKRISQYHIASYLGITASSLSRIKSADKKY